MHDWPHCSAAQASVRSRLLTKAPFPQPPTLSASPPCQRALIAMFSPPLPAGVCKEVPGRGAGAQGGAGGRQAAVMWRGRPASSSGVAGPAEKQHWCGRAGWNAAVARLAGSTASTKGAISSECKCHTLSVSSISLFCVVGGGKKPVLAPQRQCAKHDVRSS